MNEIRHLQERAQRSAEEARQVGAETRRLLQTSRELQNWTARVQGRMSGETGRQLSFHRHSNHLLAVLPLAEFSRLAALFEGVSFSRHMVLHRAKMPIDHLYFPISGLLSATITMQDGCAIEITPIGNEGATGLTAILGDGKSPHDVVVQIPGHGLRLELSVALAELKRGGVLWELLCGYHSACTALFAYQVACNGLHTAQKRCCRRLLDTQDRIGRDILPLTHESLALALGVRRATITDELGALQKRRVIDNHRGKIKILDRPQLQSLACECYEASNSALKRVFTSTGLPTAWPA